MRKDPKEFRERFLRWKAGELVYKDGLPAYEDGKEEDGFRPFENEILYKMSYPIRERLYRNIMPMGYDNPAERLFNGLVLNKKEGERDFKQPSDAYKVVDSLWGEYLGINNNDRLFDNNKYGVSKYKENGDTFYHLNDPSILYNDIREANIPRIIKTWDPSGHYHMKYNNVDVKLNQNTNARQNFILGDFLIQRKHDPKIGEYIQYTDLWDVNPYLKTTNLYGQFLPEDMPIGDKLLSKLLPKNKDASFGLGRPLKIKGNISMEKFYGIPYKSTATDKKKGEYYGGWLPELVVEGVRRK